VSHHPQQKGKANHHPQGQHQNHHQQQQRTGQPREHRKILRNNNSTQNNSTNANKQHVQQTKQTKQPSKEESTTVNHSEPKVNGDVQEMPTQVEAAPAQHVETKTDATPAVTNGDCPPGDEKAPAVLQDANKNEIKMTTEKPLGTSEETPVKVLKKDSVTTTNSSEASLEIQQES